MRRKLPVTLLLLCVLFLSMAFTACAEARLDYVSDYAGLLTETERTELNERAAQISAEYGFPVYIVTVNDHRDYVNGSVEYFAEEIFHAYGLGAGDSEDGILLALSMKERGYDIYVHGDFGNTAFTDYGKDQLARSFLDEFRTDDWAGGFSAYLGGCDELLRRAQSGDPVDIWIPDPTPAPQPQQSSGLTPGKLLISLLFGGAVSGTTVAGFSKQMKTANRQTGAANYIGQGGVELRDRQDQFINRNVTRQLIRKQPVMNNRPGNGHYGGTTISGSHGGSHHSGKF